MELNELLTNGVQLMLIGMGVVFLFLSILVISVGLMSRIAGLIAPVVELPEGREQATSGQLAPDLMAVISTVIHQFRRKSKS